MSAVAPPEVGTPTRLLTEHGDEFPSTVRGLRGADVLLVDPPQVRMLRRPVLRPGLAVTLTWARPDAEHRVCAVLERVGDDGRLELRLDGPPERVQRRRHVRAGFSVTPTVTDTAGRAWHCTTLDVSESGMRCRVDREAALTRGSRVIVSFHLDDEGFVVAAEVSWAVAGDERTHELGLEFLDPGDQADDIRRSVFAFQLRERALRRS